MAEATVLVDDAQAVRTITLNRPDKLNAFNDAMRADFRQVWREVMAAPDVNCVVLRAAGDRAFSAGIDVGERAARMAADPEPNPWAFEDPGVSLSPKTNGCWKPVVCAVQGMAAGGAFYWINESDIVICSDDATFFDPHVSYGMTSSFEPAGLRWRIPLGEVLRWALMGLDERMSAERALQIGLVSEVVPAAALADRAHEIAARIAAKPAVATQGTVKAIWQSMEMNRSAAAQLGGSFVQLGNPLGERAVDREHVERPKPWIR